MEGEGAGALAAERRAESAHFHRNSDCALSRTFGSNLAHDQLTAITLDFGLVQGRFSSLAEVWEGRGGE